MPRKKHCMPPDLQLTMKHNEAQLYRVEDLAARWRLSKASIYRMISDGRLKGVRLGPGTMRFRHSDIAALEESN
jgi:excisionase family DNA binding protein